MLIYLLTIQRKEGLEKETIENSSELKVKIADALVNPEEKIISLLEISSNLSVKTIQPVFKYNQMTLETYTDYEYDYEFSDNPDLFVAFAEYLVPGEGRKERMLYTDNLDDLKVNISSHLGQGAKIEAIYQISTATEKYKSMEIEINGFNLEIK